MAGNGQKLTGLRQRVFKMVSVGIVDDRINQGYDVISTAMLLINLFGAFAGTCDPIALKYSWLLHEVEAVTVAFFALDYVLRMYTAPCLYPDEPGWQPYMRYALSGAGIIDLLSFLPISGSSLLKLWWGGGWAADKSASNRDQVTQRRFCFLSLPLIIYVFI